MLQVQKRRYTSYGLVLKRKDYKEADRIITIFSQDYGKVTVLAKGVRKLKSRKRGHLEPFSLIFFQAAKGKNIDVLEEVETIYSFQKLRKGLKKATVAYFFVEVIDKVLREGEVNNDLYKIMLFYLRSLLKAKELKRLRENFIKDVMINLGFWPEDKDLPKPDRFLESVLHKKLSTTLIGKKILS